MYSNAMNFFHVLRSSDIAEGMQCVFNISRVAALAVFVWRTTSCSKENNTTQKSTQREEGGWKVWGAWGGETDHLLIIQFKF